MTLALIVQRLGMAGVFALVFCAPPVTASQEPPPATVTTVDCGAGESLQLAINRAQPGDRLLVTGVCAENLVIPSDAERLTLDGQETAMLHGPNANANVITVEGRAITIRSFTITGGSNGIGIERGARAFIGGNTIQDTASRPGSGSSGLGIHVSIHSSATIVNNTIQRNPGAGILVQESSYARISFVAPYDATPQGNVIRNNGPGGGVHVAHLGGARIAQNTIHDNAGAGVQVDSASEAVVSGNDISGNGSNGITVAENSTVRLGDEQGVLLRPNETNVPNQGFGIICSLNSSAVGHLATLTGVAGPQEFDPSCANALQL